MSVPKRLEETGG